MSEQNTNAAAQPTEQQESQPSEVNQTEQQEAQPSEPKKYKFRYKSDNQEIEEELDEAEISKRLSLSKAATKRMSEAARVRQEAEQLIREFNENPQSMLKRLDKSKSRTIAEQHLLEMLNEEMMTPEEKYRRDLESQIQSYKQKEEETRKSQEQKIMEQQYTVELQRFDKMISDALSSAKVPKTPGSVKGMAKLMQKNIELGLDMTPQELVAEYESEVTSSLKELISQADPETLLKLFGEEISNKIRRYDLEKFTKSKQTVQSPKVSNNEPANQPKKSLRDLLKD